MIPERASRTAPSLPSWPFRNARRTLSFLLICALFASMSPTARASGITFSLAGCTVQEHHAPVPKAILEGSMPEGFEPATYAGSPLSTMGDSATTSFVCGKRRSALSELWIWVPVIAPESLRSPAIETYGFLIKGYANGKNSLLQAERSCLSRLFERAAISMVMEQGTGGETISSYAESRSASDEVHTVVAQHADAHSERTRMFGTAPNGRVRSFDLTVASERAGTGTGMAFQNKTGLYADGTSFGIPGTFVGTARHLHDAVLTFTSSRGTGCPR